MCVGVSVSLCVGVSVRVSYWWYRAHSGTAGGLPPSGEVPCYTHRVGDWEIAPSHVTHWTGSPCHIAQCTARGNRLWEDEEGEGPFRSWLAGVAKALGLGGVRSATVRAVVIDGWGGWGDGVGGRGRGAWVLAYQPCVMFKGLVVMLTGAPLKAFHFTKEAGPGGVRAVVPASEPQTRPPGASAYLPEGSGGDFRGPLCCAHPPLCPPHPGQVAARNRGGR